MNATEVCVCVGVGVGGTIHKGRGSLVVLRYSMNRQKWVGREAEGASESYLARFHSIKTSPACFVLDDEPLKVQRTRNWNRSNAISHGFRTET